MSQMLFGDKESERIDALVDELHKTPGWPVDEIRDRALLTELVRSFPRLDLADELMQFRVWLLQQDPGEAERRVKSRGRLQTIRNWCARTGRTRAKTGRKGGGGGRTSTSARPADAFGTESSVSLSRW